ncbi:hypothetical protein VE04_03987 [Pseudogymnoascus sp. 24MN13]|nr:hypothetical protein VE04_03987 [Pseudogymnoascus sp. 24MN13]
MLPSKSVANVANLIQSPYREYVEEICWADRELQYHLHDDLEAFQDTFKERFAGLSRDDVAQWHEKYCTMYRDQEGVYSPLYDGSAQLHLESFINLKRVSTHPHAVDEKGDLARPLEELLYFWKRPTFMRLMPMLYPQLRHLEFHGFAILSRALLECLGMVRKSLRSLVFSNCVFKPTLLHSKDFFYRSIPEKPSTLTDKAITPYLVQSRMSGTLCLHDWDKQVKEYADENSGDARDVEGAEDA